MTQSSATSQPTVSATPAALALIAQLEAAHGALMFYQSGGCCDGSAPLCLPLGELLLGNNDLLLGDIGGCPFYIDAEQYARWGQPRLLIDATAGPSDSFSLEGPLGMHFLSLGAEGAACSLDPITG